jgi:ATP-dependent DNA helicase HFM1/MER3
LKIKLKDETLSDSADAEVIDLAEVVSPASYAKLAPRDHRKLYTLHTSAQPDKAIRLPKKKPGFSYASGKEPYLPFLHKSENIADSFASADSEDDEFPSPSAMAPTSLDRILSPDPFESFNLQEENAAPSSFPDNSQASLEAGMLELADTATIDVPSPQVDSSFANGFFDFDAFEERNKTPKKPIISPPIKDKRGPPLAPIMKDPLKRDRSATPKLCPVKHRRLTEDEPVLRLTQAAAIPDWVNDFDPDLINELKGFVDFVD